jgi:chemotaxis protein MotA
MIFRLFGFAILIGCLAVVYFFESSSTMTGALRIFHWPAMFLTGIGPFALVSVCSDMRTVFLSIGLSLGSTPRKRQKKHEREAILLQKVGKSFYAEGPSSVEKIKAHGLSDYVTKILNRLSSRMPTGDIRELLEKERDRKHTSMIHAMQVLSMGVRLTPSIGMLGTILGMVQLLSTLTDPSHIGSHMSLALLTTFYGLFFSLVLWTPLQQKIERIIDVEVEGYNQVIRWLELLEKRKPANYFADSVNIPLPKGQDEVERKRAA